MIRLSSLSSTRRSVWPTGADGSTGVRQEEAATSVTRRTSAKLVPAAECASGALRRPALLHRCHLSDAPLVTLGRGEAGRQELAEAVGGQLLSHDAGAEAEHVHVVV